MRLRERTVKDPFLSQVIKYFKAFGLAMGLFVVARLVYVLRFGGWDVVTGFAPDLLKAFAQGLRFDAQAVTYGFLPLVLLILPLMFTRSKAYLKFANRASVVWLTFAFFVFTTLLVCDQQFYAFFQSHINVLAFGLVEDDTSAVLTSMWTDHPVIRLVLLTITTVVVANIALRKIFSTETKRYTSNVLQSLGVFLGFALFVFVCLRGSLGTFPLQVKNASVSDNAFVNTVAPNGLFTFIKAAGAKDNTREKTDPAKLLAKFGYKSVGKASEVYFGENRGDDIVKTMFARTAKDSLLEVLKPNVVFVMMEGMGNHYIDFQSEKTNVLGRLDKHMKEDIVFRNFLSGQNGTIGSLERLAITAPFTPISSTPHRFKTFESSAAYPFSRAGYYSSFISGGYVGWRHLDEMLPKNYFDQAIGKSAILKDVEGSKENPTWGAYDQYLFDRIFMQLERGNGQPQFVFAQTTNNHTPYELPDDYKAYPIALPEDLKSVLVESEEMAVKCLTAYQYANDCLGAFMDQLKASPFAENTIVVATGDHNIRNLVNYDKYNDLMAKYGVPLYMYVPKKLREKLEVNTERFGSHKDIFPTVYNLALSDAEYFDAGVNLFGKAGQFDDFSLNSSYVGASDSVDNKQVEDRIKARQVLIEYYFNEKF
ncbi:phosphoglycerol transferase (plasmid) [Fulvitalea axinellae]|uniref:Phosphoglycerol transferase n=1 Tax=Fulvitalea axinellae TaxID=1182444 RepID=A0AAU9CXR8_9BACT|nr:phosphoglycerol transferase [Fulvitalea axinellae]